MIKAEWQSKWQRSLFRSKLRTVSKLNVFSLFSGAWCLVCGEFVIFFFFVTTVCCCLFLCAEIVFYLKPFFPAVVIFIV